MAQDYTVRLRSITTVNVLDARGNFVQVRRLSIMVGPYGPFSKDFLLGQDSPEAVDAWKLAEQAAVMRYNTDIPGSL